jgi:hypothetical protein
VMLFLLVIAGILYFGPLYAIDADALKKGSAQLSLGQAWSVVGLIGIAVIYIFLDVLTAVKKQRLSDVIRKHT